MCLIGVQWRGGRRILVAANRDEYHQRPTADADWWPASATGGSGIFGGRDLLAGGGWLAADRHGRIAAVTNVRVPDEGQRFPASRGALVADFLRDDIDAEAFLRDLAPRAQDYAGFNLLLFDGRALVYASNRVTPARGADADGQTGFIAGWHGRRLAPGIHTVSNADLDADWPKSRRLRQALAAVDIDRAGYADALFATLGDERAAEDDALPDTGVGVAMERFLSPIFIRGSQYGTRCSTVLSVDDDGSVVFRERRFGPDGQPTGDAESAWQSRPAS